MSDAVESRGWRGVHLHYPAPLYGTWCDRIVIDVVEPFVRRAEHEGWIERWFFIRYGERGSHVRFRLFGDVGRMDALLVPALDAALRTRDAAIVFESPTETGDWTQPTAAESSCFAIRRAAWTAYEPEFDRYGGPFGVAVAEQQFHDSSELAVAVLRHLDPAQRSARLGRAMLSMLVLMHAFFDERASVAAFARMYAVGYLHSVASAEDRRSEWLRDFDCGYDRQAGELALYVEEAWERLSTAESLLPELDRYRDAMTHVRARFYELCQSGRMTLAGSAGAAYGAAARGIVPSYLHMTNNRLGVSIPEEAYLAHLIHRTLLASNDVSIGTRAAEVVR